MKKISKLRWLPAALAAAYIISTALTASGCDSGETVTGAITSTANSAQDQAAGLAAQSQLRNAQTAQET